MNLWDFLGVIIPQKGSRLPTITLNPKPQTLNPKPYYCGYAISAHASSLSICVPAPKDWNLTQRHNSYLSTQGLGFRVQGLEFIAGIMGNQRLTLFII